MKIAVCDDISTSRKDIISKVNHVFTNQVTFCEFASSEELLAEYSNGKKFDIIFLDVEMKVINGIEAGRKIREYDSKAIIIFVSNYPKYAIPAYDCEALYFIVKPIENENFYKVLNKAMDKYKLLHQYYVIKNKGNVIKIPVRKIVYVEIYRKHLIIHTTTSVYETVGKLNEALLELEPFGFCQVHQGYLVNMNLIRGFSNYDVVMENGEKVMMSVRKRADVLRTFACYLERNN